MNNTRQYQALQAAHETASMSIQEWVATRALRHIDNARTIIRRANQGRRESDLIIPKDYEWASPQASRPRVSTYKPDSIEFTYQTGPWGKKETRSFEIPLSYLSLSVWDYNKRTRQALLAARNEAKRKKMESNLAKQRETRKAIEELQAKLDTLRSDAKQMSKSRTEARIERAAS